MKKLLVEGGRLLFPQALRTAQLVGRASRFVVLAELDGELVDCHCPVPGTIGGLQIDGLPCLLSGPYGDRATPYSLEAFAVVAPSDPAFQWIGLNQTAANRYVEGAFEAGWLAPLASPKLIQREQKLGSSRIDFCLDGKTWLEVKMPVDNLQLDPPEAIPRKWPMASNPKGMDRAGRQVSDLLPVLQAGERAVVLTVFCYDNDGTWREWPYRFPKGTRKESLSAKAFAAARSSGLETWRLSLRLSPTHLEFLRLEQTGSW